MDKKELLNRIHSLEKELVLLKDKLDPPKSGNAFSAFFKKLQRLLTSNRAFISLITAILTAAYIKFQYDVNYFEKYENIKASKDISATYTKMGNNLMGIGKWEAAKEMYTKALDNNKSNLEATFGLMTSTAFTPVGDDEYYALEVVDAKVDLLLGQYPDKAMVHFLSGMRYLDKHDPEKAISAFNESISLDTSFISAYISLGYVLMGTYDAKSNTTLVDLNKSIEYTEKALALDSNNATANGNYGYSLLLLGKTDEAIKHLVKGYIQSPSLVSLINCGEAYRLQGDIKAALWYHNNALESLEKTTNDNARFISGVWCYNYLPLHKNDTVTTKKSVKLYNRQQKNTFINYGLCLDYALQEKFNMASQHLTRALISDKTRHCEPYFRNTIHSLNHFQILKPGTVEWFKRNWNMSL